MPLLPNVVIAGFTKAGTSSLFQWLADHPDACGSSRKEVQYFMDRDSSVFRSSHNYLEHGLDKYGEFFAHCEGSAKVVLEATPGYVHQAAALKAFSEEPSLAEVQLVFLLRKPFDRLYSTYKYFSHNQQQFDANISFPTFIEKVDSKAEELAHNEYLREALHQNEYAYWLSLWKERCGTDRVSVFLYEDLKADAKEFTKQVATRIGLDPSFYDSYQFATQNATVTVKNHALHKLAIFVRKRIPKSAFRATLRKAYHSVNLQKGYKKPVSNQADNELLALQKNLEERYKSDLSRLQQEHGLNLDKWGV